MRATRVGIICKMLRYRCDECNREIAPVTTRSNLSWIKERQHLVREVLRHSNDGLDSWMMEALAFLEEHGEHDVTLLM